jgi:hypothetical protein
VSQVKGGRLGADSEKCCLFLKGQTSGIFALNQSRKRELKNSLSLPNFGDALDGGGGGFIFAQHFSLKEYFGLNPGWEAITLEDELWGEFLAANIIFSG